MVVSQRQAARQLTPGEKLGKYDLIRQIAIGGMAELYLARTVGIEGFEKLVVIKRILPQYAEQAGFIQMFLDEARLAATLQHANIAQVYDIGIQSGSYFFAMEYVHGEDLRRIMLTSTDQGVPVSLDAALTLIVGVSAGLHYAHQKVGPDGAPLGIVHRDVSPSNVLVSYEGGVKVVDFGIARAAGRQANTLSGGLKGKIAYMSPEQCKGGVPLDRRSDIFSIGSMLYELTTGTLPFDDGNATEFQVMTKIVNSDVEPPTRRVPAYPPQLEAIVLRAMARDPALRYATALELQRDLEDFAHENRLRISPLTLAGVMERMFPAALAEWEKARAAGAYFVEEHVVKTLVGKTIEYLGERPMPNDEDTVTHHGPVQPDDEDRTDVVNALPAPSRNPFAPAPSAVTPMPTAIPNAVPIFQTPPPGAIGGAARPPMPETLSGVGPLVIPTPVPAPPALPPMRATPPPLAAVAPIAAVATPPPGTLAPVTTRGTPPAMAAVVPAAAVTAVNPAGEMTAKVTVPMPLQLPRQNETSTDSVAAGKGIRRPILIAAALVVAAGVVAAVTVMVQKQSAAPAPPAPASAGAPAEEVAAGTAPAPAPAPATTAAGLPDVTPSTATPPSTATAPTTPTPETTTTTTPTPTPTPPPTPAPAPTKAVPDTIATDGHEFAPKAGKHGKHDRKSHTRKKPTAKPTAKPTETKKTEPPKEKPWSGDSPFMPVRTDK